MWGTNSYAGEMVPEGAKCLFSHCEKKTFASSGTISGAETVRLHRYVFFL